MSVSCSSSSQKSIFQESVATSINNACNAFIFNWVKNYDDQVNALKEAMESLQNKVKTYNRLCEQQLVEVVDNLTRTNFELCNYIVIIILDNECEYEQFIQTSDQQNVLLYSDIITRIETNPTLDGIPRIIVIQKLSDVRDMDDGDLNVISEMIQKRKTQTQTPAALNFGLSITIRANEMTDNYKESPFLEVFCQKFRDQAETEKITTIGNEIRREIKENRGYKIDIVTGSNEFTESNLIFGQGISSKVLRDFY